VAPVLSEFGVAGTLTGQNAAIHDIRINIGSLLDDQHLATGVAVQAG
jgi:hypothetical protein